MATFTFLIIAHTILLFSVTFLLGSCLSQFVVFISNQGLLGSYGLHYPLLRSKRLRDWTDYEVQYVLTRILSNFMLVGIFVLQHSLMATDLCRRTLRLFKISVSQRIIYVMASCYTLGMVMNRWGSTPDVLLWGIDTDERPFLWLFFMLLHAFGWVIIFLEARLMDPLELIGVKQIYYYHKGMTPPSTFFPHGLRHFYKRMRHGGTFCLLMMLWVHPVMTLDRFLLALLFSFYMPVAHQVTSLDFEFAQAYFSRFICKTSISATILASPKHRKHRR